MPFQFRLNKFNLQHCIFKSQPFHLWHTTFHFQFTHIVFFFSKTSYQKSFTIRSFWNLSHRTIRKMSQSQKNHVFTDDLGKCIHLNFSPEESFWILERHKCSKSRNSAPVESLVVNTCSKGASWNNAFFYI